MDVETTTVGPSLQAACPFCERPGTFFRWRRIGHCFHAECGRYQVEGERDEVVRILDSFLVDLHKALLDDQATKDHLVQEEGLHPQVLADSMMGIVPEDFDVMSRFRGPVEAAERTLWEAKKEPQGPGRPRKDRPEAQAQAKLQALNQLQSSLAGFFDGRAGWLAFFHTNADHVIRGIRLESRNGETAWLSVGPNDGTFNHALFSPTSPAAGVKDLRRDLIVVPRELDLLHLQSVGARTAQADGLRPESGYLRATALGPEVNAMAVRRLGRTPLVFYDTTRGFTMVESLRQGMHLRACQVPEGQTLGALLRDNLAGGCQALEELVRASVQFVRPYEAVRDEMDGYRRGEERELKQFEAHRYASGIVVKDIRERGRLYFDEPTAYVFLNQERQAIPVDDDNLDFQQLLNRFGVAPSDSLFKHIRNALRLEAQASGERVKVYSLCHYDRTTNRWYLFDHGHQVYRVSPDKKECVENGTDGVVFMRNPKWEPFAIGTPKGDPMLVRKALLKGLRLRENPLTRDEQAELFETWVYAMLFPELFPTRPIAALLGEKGSAKSWALRSLGRVLFGSQFEVLVLTNDSRDLDAAITSELFVAVDNADDAPAWLEDRLAVAATGGRIKRRTYYTTNTLVEYPITAYLGITSRTPNFRRDDVADRLLPFYVERLEEFEAESDLLLDVESQRNEVMTEIVGEVQRVLRALAEHKGERVRTTFRMADFANFAIKTARGKDGVKRMQGILSRLQEQQASFVAEDECLLEVLDQWLAVPGNVGRELTTAQLFSDLRQQAPVANPPLPFEFKDTKVFGKRLAELRGTLMKDYGVTERTGGGGKHYWRFNSRPNAPAVLRVVNR